MYGYAAQRRQISNIKAKQCSFQSRISEAWGSLREAWVMTTTHLITATLVSIAAKCTAKEIS